MTEGKTWQRRTWGPWQDDAAGPYRRSGKDHMSFNETQCVDAAYLNALEEKAALADRMAEDLRASTG